MSEWASTEGQVSLSTLAAGKRDRRWALAVVLISLLSFALPALFAKVKLPAVMAFIPSYESALAINDPSTPTRAAILASAVAIAGFVALLALFVAHANSLLPPIMASSGFTPTQVVAISTDWAFSLLALIVLWRRRPHSVLDLWLMVVMCAWLLDVALSGVLNASRFDLGFYAGRIYGLMAASFVLVLLLETGALYARLARSLEAERREREERIKQMQSELIHVSRVHEMGLMVWTLAHELNQPPSESPRREIVISGVPAEGDMIEVRVADTGPGLAPLVREKLFQPFTTTKAHGMGVGLSICRSIVEPHSGRLWAAHNHGGGTVFCLTVPGARVARLDD